MIYSQKISIGVLIIVAYVFIIRPIRVWFGDTIDIEIYPPFGMWYFGALIGWRLLTKDKGWRIKHFALALTGMEIVLFLFFLGFQYFFPASISVPNMAILHMILAIAVLLSSLKSIS